MRWAKRLPPACPVTLTTMVHVPALEGYWSESLGVLDLSLESLRRTTPPPFELAVLDNGSCDEVRAFLGERFAAGEIDQLFHSRRNLGKVGGWNVLFSAASGETVAYFDSDVYFLNGWLEASREVLDAFPKAAMVTAQPVPGDLSRHCEATLNGAKADPTVEWTEGDDLIPPHFVDSHRLGLGESPEEYRGRIRRRREVRLARGGASAYVSASHFQFVTRRDVLARIFPLPTSIPLGDDVALDEKLDAAGCWRLSTVDYLVHHMGNRLPSFRSELPWLDLEETASSSPPPRHRTRWRRRLAASPRVRRLVKAIHRTSYDFLYPN